MNRKVKHILTCKA